MQLSEDHLSTSEISAELQAQKDQNATLVSQINGLDAELTRVRSENLALKEERKPFARFAAFEKTVHTCLSRTTRSKMVNAMVALIVHLSTVFSVFKGVDVVEISLHRKSTKPDGTQINSTINFSIPMATPLARPPMRRWITPVRALEETKRMLRDRLAAIALVTKVPPFDNCAVSHLLLQDLYNVADGPYHAIRVMFLQLLLMQGINLVKLGVWIPTLYYVVKTRVKWNAAIDPLIKDTHEMPPSIHRKNGGHPAHTSHCSTQPVA